MINGQKGERYAYVNNTNSHLCSKRSPRVTIADAELCPILSSYLILNRGPKTKETKVSNPHPSNTDYSHPQHPTASLHLETVPAAHTPRTHHAAAAAAHNSHTPADTPLASYNSVLPHVPHDTDLAARPRHYHQPAGAHYTLVPLRPGRLHTTTGRVGRSPSRAWVGEREKAGSLRGRNPRSDRRKGQKCRSRRVLRACR